MEKSRHCVSKARKKPVEVEQLLMIPMTVEMGGFFFPGIMVTEEPNSKESLSLGKIGKPLTMKDGAFREAKDDITAAVRYGQRVDNQEAIPAYLIKRGYIPVGNPKRGRKRGLPTAEEFFSRTCAWCAGIVSDDQRVYGTGVRIGETARKALKPFYGTRILFPMSVLGRSLPVAIAEPGSANYRRGEDVVFMTCSANCSAQLKRALDREQAAIGKAVVV